MFNHKAAPFTPPSCDPIKPFNHISPQADCGGPCFIRSLGPLRHLIRRNWWPQNTELKRGNWRNGRVFLKLCFSTPNIAWLDPYVRQGHWFQHCVRCSLHGYKKKLPQSTETVRQTEKRGHGSESVCVHFYGCNLERYSLFVSTKQRSTLPTTCRTNVNMLHV